MWVVIQDVATTWEFLAEGLGGVTGGNYHYDVQLTRQSINDLCPLIYKRAVIGIGIAYGCDQHTNTAVIYKPMNRIAYGDMM
jgi:hypothetical protein